MAILQRVLIKSDMAASLCFPVPPAPPAERCRHRRGCRPAGLQGGGWQSLPGAPHPDLMNGGQSGNAFPACQCIIKANDLHILRDADALSLQKSHKFQRIVVGHRKGAAETVYPLLVHYTVFYQYILPLYAVTWVAFSFTELIVSISSLPVLPSNRRVNRMDWSKGGFIRTALLST